MAVGSSGGHIYPACAIAEQLTELFFKQFSKDNLLEIHFVHSGSQLGKKLLITQSYSVHTISIGGLAVGQNFLRKIKTLFQLPIAFFQSIFLIRRIKAEVIFGTGGSVTFPVLTSAFLIGKKTAIWEANTSLGLANKVLAVFISPVFTVFPKVIDLSQKKQIWSAYPLRKQIQDTQNKNQSDLDQSSLKDSIEEKKSENLKERNIFPKDKFKILVLGGSQGSVFLNKAVSQALEEISWRKDIFVCHQTGDKSFEELNQKYKSLEGVFAFSFSKEIQNFYKECDLIFSRAGSGSIAEMARFGKAVVLIPLTYSAGGHQLKNANCLSTQNCAQMIKEKDFNSESFKNKILELKKDSVKRKELGQNLKNTYQQEDKIACWILDQLRK